MGPAREPGTELLENRQRDSRSTQETGCLWMDRESSYSEWNDGRVREARALLEGRERFRSDRSCDLGAEPGLRKIGERGRDLEREIALCFCVRHSRRAPPKTV